MTIQHQRWGAKIGPRIAMLVSHAIIHTHSKLIHVKHKLAMSIFRAISDEISEEVDVTLGPFLKMIHSSLDESHPAYPAINFLHTNHGQLKALVGTGLQTSGLLSAVAEVMNNELISVVYDIIGANPGQLPDIGTIASAYASGSVSRDEALHDIGSLGIQFGWANRILDLSQSWPGLTEAIELARRTGLDRGSFVDYLKLNGTPEDIANRFWLLVSTPLSPADLALAVLRGNMNKQDAIAQAYQTGTTPDQLDVIIGNTGEPPGLMQLLEAYRRGIITKPVLERGILQSRYRDEWIPMLEALRYSPMSVADAVNAAVQNQLTDAEASAIADQNGLEPGQYQTLRNTAGEPLSRTELEELYNRGEVSEAQVIQGLRESRLKNKYNDLAFALHSRIPPITVLQRALRYGGITHDQAVKVAMENGYSQDYATMIVNAAASERLRVYKDQVVSAVHALYEDNIISEADANALTEEMGYDATEASFILKSSELKREAKILSQVVNSIRSKYLSRHITATQASNFLDAVGVPSDKRDELMKIWGIEQGAFTRELTEAQIVKAVNLQLITADDGTARLVNMGYSQDDATLLIEGA